MTDVRTQLQTARGDSYTLDRELGDGGMSRVSWTRGKSCDDLSIISIPERKEMLRLPIGDGPKHITVARIPRSVIAAIKTAPRVTSP